MVETVGGISVDILADDKTAAGIRSASASFKAFGEQLKGVGTTLTQSVSLPLVGFGTAAVLAAGETDRLTKSLIAVTGDAAEAGRQMERLRDIARAPGLGFSEAIQASVGLQAVGLDAQTAERAIREFGNALATTGGTKEDFATVIQQFTQIQSLGKVTAENLNVIRERAPAIAGALQDAFAGVDLTTVPVENFNAVVLATLEGLGRAAPSLLEPFVNAFDDVKAALVPLGVSIAGTVTPVLQSLIPVVQALSDAFAGLSPEMQQIVVVVGLAAVALGPFLVGLGAVVAAVGAALPVLASIGTAFALLSGPVVAAIGLFALFVAGALAVRGGLAEMNAEAARSGGTLGGFAEGARDAANAADAFANRLPAVYNALNAIPVLGPGIRAFFDQFRAGADSATASLDRLSKARILSAGESAFFDRIRANAPGGGGAPAVPDVVTTPEVVKPKTIADVRTLADVTRDLSRELAEIATRARVELLPDAEVATLRVRAFRTALDGAYDVSPNGGRGVAAIAEQLRAASAAAGLFGQIATDLTVAQRRFADASLLGNGILAERQLLLDTLSARQTEYDRILRDTSTTEAARADALEKLVAARRAASASDAATIDARRSVADLGALADAVNDTRQAYASLAENAQTDLSIPAGQLQKAADAMRRAADDLRRAQSGEFAPLDNSEIKLSAGLDRTGGALTEITPLLREAAEQTRALADNLASAFSGAVVDGAFGVVGALLTGRDALAALGDAATDFGSAFVDSLKGVLAELGRVLLRGLAVRAILGVLGLVSGGAAGTVAGILGVAAKAAPALAPAPLPVGRFGDAQMRADGIFFPYEMISAGNRAGLQFEAASGRGSGA